MSTVSPPVGSPARPPADAATLWEGMSELGNLKRVGASFVSRGHFAGRFRAEVFANARASAKLSALEPSTRFEPGALMVEKHQDATSAVQGPIFAMHKREEGYFPAGGDWEYVAADAAGFIDDRGQLASCARCHAEAPTDWVFRVPNGN